MIPGCSSIDHIHDIARAGDCHVWQLKEYNWGDEEGMIYPV